MNFLRKTYISNKDVSSYGDPDGSIFLGGRVSSSIGAFTVEQMFELYSFATMNGKEEVFKNKLVQL